jgi:hypothetical protein
MTRIIEQKMNQAISSGQNFTSGNTTVIFTEEKTEVLLHGNKIATIGDTFLQIFDGGWQSKITKSRLNAILKEHGHGASIFQKNFEWFVNDNGKDVPFESGMILQ